MCKGMRRAASCGVLVMMVAAGAGCENKAQSGALIGAGGGALAGAIIGHQSGHAGTGALIGTAVGAGGGYIVGNEMDKKDQREQEAYYRQTRGYRESRYADQPAAAPAAARGQTAQGVTKQDVMGWTERGVKDEIIIDRVERSGQRFRLTPAEENEMRDAGVSEEVIRSMKNTARR